MVKNDKAVKLNVRHEGCPACGGDMEAAGFDLGFQIVDKPGRNGWCLVCWRCVLWFGMDAPHFRGKYKSADEAWEAWDTAVAEQRGRWVEAHACDGCVFPPSQ